MKIGIFDSGLGGLSVLAGIRKALPEYEYVYLGDTKHVPYGNQTRATIYTWSKAAVDYLFRKEKCQIIIIACNTVSVQALRRLQREYLPHAFPNRRILGVVVPTLEIVEQRKLQRVGLIGTTVTVRSKVYKKELQKLNKNTKLYMKATPKLVPLLENHELARAKQELRKHLSTFKHKKLDALVLGCTHYCLLKHEAKRVLGSRVQVLSQDEIIPKKLRQYLRAHPEMKTRLGTHGTLKLLYTKHNSNYTESPRLPASTGQKFQIVKLVA